MDELGLKPKGITRRGNERIRNVKKRKGGNAIKPYKEMSRAKGKKYILTLSTKQGKREYYKETLKEIKESLDRARRRYELVTNIFIKEIETNKRYSQKDLDNINVGG